MASGAIGSPQIMQASGISSGAVSQKIGIQNIIELPGVGENLQDHLQMRLVFKVKNTKTLNLRANSLFGKIGMGLEYFLFKRGPMTMAPSQLGGFAKSDKIKKLQTFNIIFNRYPLRNSVIHYILLKHSQHLYVICVRRVGGMFI